MSYYQKFVTAGIGRKAVLLLTVGFFTLTGRTQHHVNFSGEWKLNESKSEVVREQFPLCIFGGDRMRSKTLKIVAQANYMTVDAAGSSWDGALETIREKLIFDGKDSKATYVGMPREESNAKWSDDGQTMTVHSVRSFDTAGGTADFKVTEVWKLINGGKSIAIEVRSSSISREDTMTLVYDKQWAEDYRF